MQKVYTKIESIVGNVINDPRLGCPSGRSGSGGQKLCQRHQAGQGSGHAPGFQRHPGRRAQRIRCVFSGRPMMVSFSEHLLGRIFDGAGVPRDNGPALTENMIPIGGPSVNPSRRTVPNKMIRTGIPMIDVFNTLVESQKLPIFSVSGEPYNRCSPASPCRRRWTLSFWAAWA